MQRRRAAFTLIEMLAVVAIFALMAGIIAPNLGMVGRRALRNDADALSGQLELARQRAVVTSVPHRLVLDLEGSVYWVEWLRTEAQENGEEPVGTEELELRPDRPLPLTPPETAVRSYYRLSGPLGKEHLLDDDVVFAGLETPDGWIGQGDAYVEFQRDGTASYTVIVLETASGEEALQLEVLPLAEAVRVRDADG